MEIPASLVPALPSQRWSAVTIQVAWTLLRQGVRPGGQTLVDAREHVLGSLPDSVPDEQIDPITTPVSYTHLTLPTIYSV